MLAVRRSGTVVHGNRAIGPQSSIGDALRSGPDAVAQTRLRDQGIVSDTGLPVPTSTTSRSAEPGQTVRALIAASVISGGPNPGARPSPRMFADRVLRTAWSRSTIGPTVDIAWSSGKAGRQVRHTAGSRADAHRKTDPGTTIRVSAPSAGLARPPARQLRARVGGFFGIAPAARVGGQYWRHLGGAGHQAQHRWKSSRGCGQPITFCVIVIDYLPEQFVWHVERTGSGQRHATCGDPTIVLAGGPSMATGL